MLSATVAVVLCEAFSRWIAPMVSPHFLDLEGRARQLMRPDPELGELTRANLDGWIVAAEYRTRVETNGDGFRTAHDLRRAEDGRLRIVAAGDSFTFGMGVGPEESYAALLERQLNQNGVKSEVINLGVIGFSTLQEIALLRRYDFASADFVVLGFVARDVFVGSGGNDLEDNYTFWQTHRGKQPDAPTSAAPSEPEARPWQSWTRDLRKMLLWNSNLYRLVELQFGGQLRRRYAPADMPGPRQRAWEITADALRDLDGELARRNLRCLLVWIPYPATVATQDDSVAQRLAALRLERITVLDLLKTMRANAAAYYYSLDSHWTAAGHAAAASAIHDAITTRGFLPIRTEVSK